MVWRDRKRYTLLAHALFLFSVQFLAYSVKMSCCNSVDIFFGISGTHVAMALRIAKAFILANGCWPVAISSYRNQIRTSWDRIFPLPLKDLMPTCPSVCHNLRVIAMHRFAPAVKKQGSRTLTRRDRRLPLGKLAFLSSLCAPRSSSTDRIFQNHRV